MKDLTVLGHAITNLEGKIRDARYKIEVRKVHMKKEREEKEALIADIEPKLEGLSNKLDDLDVKVEAMRDARDTSSTGAYDARKTEADAMVREAEAMLKEIIMIETELHALKAIDRRLAKKLADVKKRLTSSKSDKARIRRP